MLQREVYEGQAVVELTNIVDNICSHFFRGEGGGGSIEEIA